MWRLFVFEEFGKICVVHPSIAGPTAADLERSLAKFNGEMKDIIGALALN